MSYVFIIGTAFLWLAAGCNVYLMRRQRRLMERIIECDKLMCKLALAMSAEYITNHPPQVALPAWAATMGHVKVETSISVEPRKIENEG